MSSIVRGSRLTHTHAADDAWFKVLSLSQVSEQRIQAGDPSRCPEPPRPWPPFCRDHLQCESALGGERLCGELGRLRMADRAVEGVILRILAGERPLGFKKHGLLAGSGSYGVLAKTR